MGPDEAAMAVMNKLMRLEPEHVVKRIMGYIHFQGITGEEMIRLALGPDCFIHTLIHCAKTARLSNPTYQVSSFIMAPPPRPLHTMLHPYLDHQHHQVQKRNPPLKLAPHCDYMNLEDPMDGVKPNDYYHPEALSVSRSPMCYPVKTCHYFNRGYCKHGRNCRYLHAESSPEVYSHAFGYNKYDMAGGDQAFSPGSLEKVEWEIVELLKSRKGNLVSIASLPMLYYEKYGKHLQADGYLTESQRHGKAGYSLTKLLARLKNSIHLIDRPHGQHDVVLAEDALKYMDIRSARNEPEPDPGHIVPGARQIYMTFPSDSSFTEDDVSRYFNTFGPVQDVRIPPQPKRMFGFVTFASADTVKLILSTGNPHYVRNARVLVKQYKEKSKLLERKYLENFDRQVYYNSHPDPVAMESKLQASNWQSSRLFQRQQQQQQLLMQEHEQTLELERMHLAQLLLPSRSAPDQPYFGYSMSDLQVAEDQQPNFSPTEAFNYLLDDFLNSPRLDNLEMSVDNGSDQESSQELNLLDSPFAAAVANRFEGIL